jgi:hypothetical protein
LVRRSLTTRSPHASALAGEVYHATDTKLGRDVAIKVLPEVFASDPDRVVRFEREAKLLASLNHPNIAGDMYAAVPRMTPAPVAAILIVGDCESCALACSMANAFARPKSRTFTVPSGSNGRAHSDRRGHRTRSESGNHHAGGTSRFFR